MEMSRLWVGMLTRDLEHAGTDDSITLTVNVAGVERLNYTFPDTSQADQQRGQANLYEVNVEGRNIVHEELSDSSIRVGIRGKDAWRPEHFMVWGNRVSMIGLAADIIPLAIETDITVQLSTEANEGPASFPLRLVGRGNRNTQINRLFMLMTTAGSGTDSPLEIQIVSDGQLVVLSDITDTSQDDLKAGGANFYSAPVIAPFFKRNLDDHSITLRIKGRDDWEPSSFFLFGLDDATGRPEFLVPLVHLPLWPYGVMKADPTTGVASVTLKLARDPLLGPDEQLPLVQKKLDAISTGQETIVQLLKKLVAKQE
jgi:hypothetical protein